VSTSPAFAPRNLLPPTVTAAASFVVVLAVFAPWYTTQVGEAFVQGSASGWTATLVARIAAVAAAIAMLICVAIVADARDVVAVSEDLVRMLVIACTVCCATAATLVAYRTIFIPEPTEFLTRDLGLFVAMAASLVALGAAVVQLVIGMPSAADTPVRGHR
jgi:hypothetical protein